MDALDVLKVCLRRWYVVLPVVLLSLAAGIGLALQQKPTYTAFGSYALVYHSSGATKEGGDPTEPNPLATNGAVVLGEALVADFMSGTSQATFGGVGNSGTAPREPEDGSSYSVSLPDGSQSYVVQTWGTDPESLRRVVESVLVAAPLRAAQIQDRAGAPERSQYTTFVTGSAQLTKLPLTSTPKLIVALLGVGILAGSALSLVVDRLLRSRKDRATKRAPRVRERSGEEPGLPPEAYDSGTITKLPTSGAVPVLRNGNQPGATTAEEVKLESEASAGFDGAAATEAATEQVHAEVPTELSAHQAEVVHVGQIERVPDQAEAVPAVQAEEVPVVQAEEVPADQAEELPVVQAEEESADQAEELPAVQAEEESADQAEEESADQAEEVSADQNAEVPTEQTEEVLADQADEESRINQVDAEQRQELETKSLPEHTREPDVADHGDHESEADNSSWPLLEHNREFEAQGAVNHHTRDRQPAH